MCLERCFRMMQHKCKHKKAWSLPSAICTFRGISFVINGFTAAFINKLPLLLMISFLFLKLTSLTRQFGGYNFGPINYLQSIMCSFSPLNSKRVCFAGLSDVAIGNHYIGLIRTEFNIGLCHSFIGK